MSWKKRKRGSRRQRGTPFKTGEYPKNKRCWMRQAFGGEHGALHRQLGISQDQKIPESLLKAILDADEGETITNPTDIGNKKIRVTGLLKKRVNPVVTADYPELRA